eukprot:TRINITY_DN21330_c0_g1_i2.p1 TRINITY_DN21330_c0_g1~~TRINITY_DN21330_c0_g1_i2.p1  ORF type:complete len:380 (-),score=37.57 TRINITY_DN21330_c0_g1_i2:41-1180(-)
MHNEVQKHLKHHLNVSGHAAVALENLIVMVGGWRKRRTEPDVHLYVVDLLGGPAIRQPVLTSKSARPERRIRHSCCVVRPDNMADSAFQQRAILMLGGCHDQTHEPLPGLHMLNLLSFSGTDGSEACWSQVLASGSAPQSIWHHACGSFARGKRVVVFGGDFPESDPEFQHIQDRFAASIVYVLNVDNCSWERVRTGGLRPSWRSLHVGVVHASLKDAGERLIVFGGSAEHIEIFSSGEAEDMCGYALDLQTWTWSRGPRQTEFHDLPPGRMRCATDRFGRYLLVYGGHGDGDDDLVGMSLDRLPKLDLLTLSWSWSTMDVQAFNYPNIAATTLAGGVIFGGVQMKASGASLVPKFDFLHLGPLGSDVVSSRISRVSSV